LLADVRHGVAGSWEAFALLADVRHGNTEERVSTDFTDVCEWLGARCFQLICCFLSTSRFCELLFFGYESTKFNQILQKKYVYPPYINAVCLESTKLLIPVSVEEV